MTNTGNAIIFVPLAGFAAGTTVQVLASACGGEARTMIRLPNGEVYKVNANVVR